MKGVKWKIPEFAGNEGYGNVRVSSLIEDVVLMSV